MSLPGTLFSPGTKLNLLRVH